jgi:hypothetical protein
LRFEIPWHWPLVIALTAYFVSGISVVIGRLAYNRRRRLLSRIEAATERRAASDAATGHADIEGIFSGVSLEEARQLPFEIGTGRHENEVLARFLVSSLGIDRITKTASSDGPRTSRWKRIAALRLLALARPADALPMLDAAAHDTDEEVVAAAVATLGSVREPRAADLLVEVLLANRFAPSRVATFLDRFPIDVPDSLRPLLAGTTPTTRYWGAVLARRYRNVPWLEQALIRLSADLAPIVRKGAIQSLAILGCSAGVPVAVRALTDPISYVRAHAARALGVLQAAAHANEVTALLADREWWVRQAAKEALVRMGDDAEQAVIACLSHPDRFARNTAAEILQNTGAFERMLTRELIPGTPAVPETLRLLRRAGEARLALAVVEQLPPELRSRAEAALAMDEPAVAL